jgi:hypothetical protein
VHRQRQLLPIPSLLSGVARRNIGDNSIQIKDVLNSSAKSSNNVLNHLRSPLTDTVVSVTGQDLSV